MSELFLKIVSMSVSASWIVLFVVILRMVLIKSSKWMHVLLWGIVALRLVCPFSIESSVSLVPKTLSNGELIEELADDYIGDIDIHHSNSSYYDAAVGAGRKPIYDGETGYYVVTKHDQLGEPSTIKNTVVPVVSKIWLLGILVLGVYAVGSYWRLRKRVETAIRYQGNIFQSEHIDSPFVLGVIRPRIYLPFRLDEEERAYVIAHEKAHIQRRDYWWKPLGFILGMIHWFNPVIWLAYVLFCRDIELACDEKVIKNLSHEERANYSQVLVSCSMNQRMVTACPVAFGEVGVKERIRSIMHYRKPRFWMVLLSVVACIAAAVCFLTDPKQGSMSEAVVESSIQDGAESGGSQEKVGSESGESREQERLETDRSEVERYEKIADMVFHLELSTLGKEFRDMETAQKEMLMSEYGNLLEEYYWIAHESTDGTVAYILGMYGGDPQDSPLYKMKHHTRSEGKKREYQLLYTEEEEALVDEKGADAGVGYVLDNSRITIYYEQGLFLIEPERVGMSVQNVMTDYLSLGSAYIRDAVSRNVSINVPEEPYLSVYRLSEKYGEITEFIPLNAGQATDILKGERMNLEDGFGFGASLYMDGELYYYGGSKNIPKVALDLAVERCEYEFMTPNDTDDTIVKARLDCTWLKEPRYAESEDLERLQEILTNARFDGVGGCGYDAKLTITLADGKELVMFKGSDSCDTMVFGSYGGYTIGREENTEFWNMFGLDADTKALVKD